MVLMLICFSLLLLQAEVGGPSRAIQRRAIDALHLKNRAAEEKNLVQREMARMINHLQEQQTSIQASMSDNNHPGVNAVHAKAMFLLSEKLKNAMLMFQDSIDISLQTDPHVSPEVYSPLEEDEDVEEDDDDDEEEDVD